MSTPVEQPTRRASSLCIAIAAKGCVDLRPCLGALASHASGESGSIVLHVVHDRELDWPQLLEAFPRLSMAPASSPGQGIRLRATRVPEQISILKFWGRALAEAEQDYVAILDASCPPGDTWLEVVRAEMHSGTPIFYGPVHCAWEAADGRSLGYFIEYAQFMAPVQCKGEYPGNNIVLQRKWLGPREALAERGFFKTFLLWGLERERGLIPRLCDAMPVLYQKELSIAAYLRRRRDHGRCFAARRFEQAAQPPRLACILFTPLLPLLRCLRIWRGIKPHAALRRAFPRHLLLILLAEAAWSLGEFLGYCFGDNGTCDRLD